MDIHHGSRSPKPWHFFLISFSISIYLRFQIYMYIDVKNRVDSMDEIQNPFSPGAGAPPPELVGRDGILEEARILLDRIKLKRPEKSMLLTGLRGVGKTVLLNEIEHMAIQKGYRTIFIETHENKPLGQLIVHHLWKLLFDLDRMAGLGNKVKRALSAVRSFLGRSTSQSMMSLLDLILTLKGDMQIVEIWKLIYQIFLSLLPKPLRSENALLLFLLMSFNF